MNKPSYYEEEVSSHACIRVVNGKMVTIIVFFVYMILLISIFVSVL